MGNLASLLPAPSLQTSDQPADLRHEKIEHFPFKGTVSLCLMRKVIQIKHAGKRAAHTLNKRIYSTTPL